MNRSIKFRIALKQPKRLIEISGFVSESETQLRFWYMKDGQLINESALMSDCRLQQFTGMVDKNNTPIYEDDIVKAAWMHHGKPGTEFTAYIHYNEHIGSFRIAYDSLGGGAQDEVYFRYQIEVIGNRLFNPELLKP